MDGRKFDSQRKSVKQIFLIFSRFLKYIRFRFEVMRGGFRITSQTFVDTDFRNDVKNVQVEVSLTAFRNSFIVSCY